MGDGGLFDNRGIESLIQVMLNRLKQGTAKRVLIIAFDASYPFAIGGERLTRNPKGFELFVDDPGRIVGIMEERATAYQALLWQSLRASRMPSEFDKNKMKLIVLRHTDAEWSDKDRSDLVKACGAKAAKWTPEEIKEHLAEIPTRLKISECDNKLLLAAAAKIVTQKEGDIRSYLNAQ